MGIGLIGKKLQTWVEGPTLRDSDLSGEPTQGQRSTRFPALVYETPDWIHAGKVGGAQRNWGVDIDMCGNLILVIN
jgi:hypothetical protein